VTPPNGDQPKREARSVPAGCAQRPERVLRLSPDEHASGETGERQSVRLSKLDAARISAAVRHS